MQTPKEILSQWDGMPFSKDTDWFSEKAVLRAMEEYAQQFKDNISDMETKHSEDLANYNSYAASEIESRWEENRDRLIAKYESDIKLFKLIDEKHLAVHIWNGVIDDLKKIEL
jgi:hypothetical protein